MTVYFVKFRLFIRIGVYKYDSCTKRKKKRFLHRLDTAGLTSFVMSCRDPRQAHYKPKNTQHRKSFRAIARVRCRETYGLLGG